MNTRRATNFSQADQDLRRFLAARSLGQEEGPAEPPPCRSPQSEGGRRELLLHRRIYGSVEALDQDQARTRRFRIETASDNLQSPDIPTTPVLENPEHQTKWYYKYFLGKLHQNLIGLDVNKNVFVLSVLQEKTYGKTQCRVILWTKEGPKRLRFQAGKALTVKQILANLGQPARQDKLPREVVSPNIQKDILWLEKQEGSMNFKFGVIYAKAGQIMDDELFSNESGSERFRNFLGLLGERVRLKDFSKFRGGLDVRGDMTGTHSVYTTQEEHEIMFHVSTLLPYKQDDCQQVERKRHIGNDIVNIIFVDGDRADMARFKPVFIKSQFTHVYAVVCWEEATTSYHMAVFSEKSVSLYGPSLPAGTAGFRDPEEFRRFLIIKCINGEKATYNTGVFSTKRERTFQILLEEVYSQYGKEESKPCSSRKSITDSLPDSRIHTNRRRENQRDVFVKVGQSLKLDNTLTGELGVLSPASSAYTRRQRLQKGGPATKAPWEPHCVFPSLQLQVVAGDYWAGVGVLVAAKEGAWILRPTKEKEKVFQLTTIVQLNIMESLGIIIFRTARIGKEQGQVWVYRLSSLETAQVALGREELREHSMEASKGCTLYSVSHSEHSVLRLAVVTGRRLLVYRWQHKEEWMTFTEDTVQGFELVQEVSLVDPALVVTLLERREEEPMGQVLLGTKKGWELVDLRQGERQLVLGLSAGDSPTQAQELWEDDRMEVLLTYSCTSLLLAEEAGVWGVSREIHWNCQPQSLVPAFPYLLALSTDTMEIRSPVNGTLMHTLNLPRLLLVSSKDDIYFTTTKQGYSIRKNSEMEPMSKFCDPTSHMYKIPWACLVGSGGVGREDGRTGTPTGTSQSTSSSTDPGDSFSRTNSQLSYQSQLSGGQDTVFPGSPGSEVSAPQL